MKTFKKVMLLMMTLALLVSLISCSSSDSSTDDSSDTSTDVSSADDTSIDDSAADNASIADDDSGNLMEGSWVYTVSSGGEAVLLWGDGAEKSENVVMIPAKLESNTVTTLGNGEQNVLSNNKVENNFVLIPTSMTTVNERTVYDYNDTAGWVFPGTITSIAENALLSCQGGVYYIEQGSVLEDYVENAGKTSAYLTQGNYNEFTVSAGDKGYIQPNGTYYLPIAMLAGAYSKNISIVADTGYKIASVTVDGEAYDFLGGDAKRTRPAFLTHLRTVLRESRLPLKKTRKMTESKIQVPIPMKRRMF